jgi:hypothetical protein
MRRPLSILLAWNSLKGDMRVRQFFLKAIARAVRLSRAPLIAVEGYVVDDLAPELIKLLGAEYRCWTADAAPCRVRNPFDGRCSNLEP